MNAKTTFDNGETMDFETMDLDTMSFEGSRLAYIRAIDASEARALGAVSSDIILPEGIQLYAIHTADGSPVDDKLHTGAVLVNSAADEKNKIGLGYLKRFRNQTALGLVSPVAEGIGEELSFPAADQL